MAVSIPFKRERLSEPTASTSTAFEENEFQFPSNGKDFLNSTLYEPSHSKG